METIGLLAGIGTLPVEFIEAVRPRDIAWSVSR